MSAARLDALGISATFTDGMVTMTVGDLSNLLDVLDRYEASAKASRWVMPMDSCDRRDPRNERR